MHRRRPAQRGKPALGRQRHRVAPALHPLAEQFLAAALGVTVGGIDGIESGVESGVEDAAGFGVVRVHALHEAPGLAERHRAEAQGAHFQSTFPVLPMLHRFALRTMLC